MILDNCIYIPLCYKTLDMLWCNFHAVIVVCKAVSLNIPVDYPNWECEVDTREIHGNKYCNTCIYTALFGSVNSIIGRPMSSWLLLMSWRLTGTSPSSTTMLSRPLHNTHTMLQHFNKLGSKEAVRQVVKPLVSWSLTGSSPHSDNVLFTAVANAHVLRIFCDIIFCDIIEFETLTMIRFYFLFTLQLSLL